MIKTEIIADSLNPQGKRLTTFILEYPRMVHAELMTHRMFSKNSASSRAIPFEKFVEQIMTNPAMPEFWGKNQSGMQAAEELDNTKRREANFWNEIEGFKDRQISGYQAGMDDYPQYSYNITEKEEAKIRWLEARDSAIAQAKQLHELGLHKQIVNRILEPWFHIRIILSATDFGNWFALRCHKDAQPEIQKLAYSMLEDYNKSTPIKLLPSEWHIPFGDKMDISRILPIIDESTRANPYAIQEIKRKIAIARCARVSYFNFDGKDDYEADVKLCDRLFKSSPKHLSPTEHVAQCMDDTNFYGNFCGWKQYRKFFQDENLNDNRVIQKS